MISQNIAVYSNMFLKYSSFIRLLKGGKAFQLQLSAFMDFKRLPLPTVLPQDTHNY